MTVLLVVVIASMIVTILAAGIVWINGMTDDLGEKALLTAMISGTVMMISCIAYVISTLWMIASGASL